MSHSDQEKSESTFSALRKAGEEGVDCIENRGSLLELQERMFGRPSEPLVVRQFRILRRIGSGGMGVVYEAYDTQLQRHVALKVVSYAVVTQGLGQSLLQEARAMARISHPNVVQVYEVGSEGEETFIAMELVHGVDLRQWQSSRRSARQVLSIFRQAGEGLAALHRAGLAHGDFKPQNVLVARDGRARVVDFGLVRAARGALVEVGDAAAAAGEVEPPASGAFSQLLGGTPAYMAPEQAKGAITSALTDQFGFCVALYEALYGEHPFKGSEPFTKRSDAVVPDVSEDRRVPAWLRRVVVRGLAVDPARRWPSLEALLRELDRDPARGRRRLLAAALGCGLAVAAVVAFKHREAARARVCAGVAQELAGVWDAPQKDAVQTAFAASRRPYATAAFGQVDAMLTRYAEHWVVLSTDVCEASHFRPEGQPRLAQKRAECLEDRRASMKALVGELVAAAEGSVEHAVEAVSALPPLSICTDGRLFAAESVPLEQANVRAQVADVRTRLRRAWALRELVHTDQALALSESALRDARATGYEPIQAEAELMIGDVLHMGGADPKAVLSHLEQAVWIGTAVRHDRVVARASTVIMFYYGYFLGQREEANRWRSFAEAAVRRFGLGGVEEAYFRNDLGAMLSLEGDHDAARREMEAAIVLKQRLWGDDNVEVAKSQNNLGAILEETGQLAGALQTYRRALDTAEKKVGEDHLLVAVALGNIGGVLALQRDHAAAVAALLRALDIYARNGVPEHAWASAVWSGLCRTSVKQRLNAQAEEECDRAVRLAESGFGKQSTIVAESLALEAEALFDAARLEEARRAVERSIAIYEVTRHSSAKMAEARFVLAKVLSQEKGGDARARDHARAAAQSLREAGPSWAATADEVESWLASR